MSGTRLFNHLIRKYLRDQNPRGCFRKVAKHTGIVIGCGTLAALPAVSVSRGLDNENIVANVNGALRFLRSLKIGLWISVDYYFSMLGLNEASPNYRAMMSRIHQRAANNILEGCLQNGGSYIKLGQGLVSMDHILPIEYIQTLRALQDKCLTRKADEIRKLFLQDFGKEPSEIFKYFDNEPIAAASIAQVYRAKTKDDHIVAVKVQYIDLQERFKSDVSTINTLLKIAAFMHPNFNFAWVLDDLESALRQELDFINEGRNSERCARDLQHLKYIYVPKVFWDYTSSRVLVTEFIEGYKINDVANLRKNGYSLADIDKKLFEAFGHQIFQTGFVHADPHPGNVFVRRREGRTELVLIDHGLYQYMSDKDRAALSQMWKAIVLTDHAKMKKYSKELGVENYEIFAEILTQTPLKTSGFRLKTRLSEKDLKEITEFARDRFDRIMECLQAMPRTLLLVIRNLNTIRAIASDHGNPIDRYSILARAATRSVYDSQNSISKKLLNIPLKLYFEISLKVNIFRTWLTKIMMKVLNRLGMAPDISLFTPKANMG